MLTPTEPHLVRRALLGAALPLGAAASLALAVGLAVHALTLAHALSPAARVDDVVVLVIVIGGASLAAWFGWHLTVGSVCLLGAALGRRWRAGERLLATHGPVLVRRAVAAGLGLSIGLSGLAASAHEPTLPDLGWAPTTPVAPAPVAHPEPAAADAASDNDDAPVPAPRTPDEAAPEEAAPDEAAPDDRTTSRTHVVAPGDSLWSITKTVLDDAGDADTDDASVAAAWPVLFDANRDVVGSDPDLIHPGQELTVPATLEELP